jgi:uncharacterized Zn finger protein
MVSSALVKKKAADLLQAGRVKLESTGGHALYFSVEGDTGERQVSFKPAKHEWSCDCPYSSLYPGKECSHIIACRLLLEKSRAEIA